MQACIQLHEEKPWVPNFKRVLIQPLQTVQKEWLGESIMRDDQLWYVPTKSFWEVHCNASHGGGATCDSQAHISFLTESGENAEFKYAYELQDGSMMVLSADQFDEECIWWGNNFQSYLKKISSSSMWNPLIFLLIIVAIFIILAIYYYMTTTR